MSAVPNPESVQPVAVDQATGAAAQAAMRTFWRLADAWKLTTAQQLTLLGVDRATLYQWKQGEVGPLDPLVQERLVNLFDIDDSLRILLPLPERANEWLRKPSAAAFLGDSSALDRMLGGQVSDLSLVRRHLDGECRGKG